MDIFTLKLAQKDIDFLPSRIVFFRRSLLFTFLLFPAGYHNALIVSHTSTNVKDVAEHATGRGVYALYIPRRLNRLLVPQIFVRPELSPDSAPDLGFRWVEDIGRYEQEKGLAAVAEWLSIYWPRVINGYSLGVPRFKRVDLVGLYRPRTD